jgi:putative transposase
MSRYTICSTYGPHLIIVEHCEVSHKSVEITRLKLTQLTCGGGLLNSRPPVSDDNPYSESLFRTPKYTPAYPNKPFESIEVARKWMHDFVQWDNNEHRHSAIRYVTLNQRHRGADKDLLKQRDAAYEAARERNPERWSGKTRDWNPVTEVWLNPPKENQMEKPQGLKVA